MDEQEIRLYTEALQVIKEVLDAEQVTFWLDYGTLLAAYRDGHPLDWDKQDIDVSCLQKSLTQEKLDSITKRFDEKGWQATYALTPLSYLFQRTFKKGDIHIDLWVFHRKENHYWRTWVQGNGLYIWLITPMKYYEHLKQTVKYCGIDFLIPNQIEDYLILSYGLDWKTPIGGNWGDKFEVRKRVQYERFIDWIDGKYDEQKYLKEGYK